MLCRCWQGAGGRTVNCRHYCCRIETISWSPRAYIYHNFLSDEEIRHMLDLVETTVRVCRHTRCQACVRVYMCCSEQQHRLNKKAQPRPGSRRARC